MVIFNVAFNVDFNVAFNVAEVSEFVITSSITKVILQTPPFTALKSRFLDQFTASRVLKPWPAWVRSERPPSTDSKHVPEPGPTVPTSPQTRGGERKAGEANGRDDTPTLDPCRRLTHRYGNVMMVSYSAQRSAIRNHYIRNHRSPGSRAGTVAKGGG